MSAGGLPHNIDFRALAAREVSLNGTLALEKMPRLQDAVHGARGSAAVVAQLRRDEMRRYTASLQIAMPVDVVCQRCLEPMQVMLEAQSEVAAIWTEAQCAELPESLDPLVTGEETDLWALVEDELLLVLPPYPLHDDVECGRASGRVTAPTSEGDAEAVASRENPFAVLEALRSDKQD
jgi:uncharacterized protein